MRSFIMNRESVKSMNITSEPRCALVIADQVIIIDNTYELAIIAEIEQNKMIYCTAEIPEWSHNTLDLFKED